MSEHYQRTIDEARANNYPHAGRGITMGTVLEHDESGAWVLVTDVSDDGERIRFVNLDVVDDADVAVIEDASGCVEHARIGRDLASSYADVDLFDLVGPADERFTVLGPTHPDHNREKRRLDGGRV